MWIGLAAVLAPVWLWLVRASLDMYGDMTGASAWMMRASWDAPFTALDLRDVERDDGRHDAAVGGAGAS